MINVFVIVFFVFINEVKVDLSFEWIIWIRNIYVVFDFIVLYY